MNQPLDRELAMESLRDLCFRRQVRPKDVNFGRPACHAVLEEGMHGPVVYCTLSAECPNREPFFHGDHTSANDAPSDAVTNLVPVDQPVKLRLVR